MKHTVIESANDKNGLHYGLKIEIPEARRYTQFQLNLAKKVSQFMLEHNMDEKVTIEQLEEHFQVSGTSIKKAFKGVYGASVASYIRARKMDSAAVMLEYTDKSILEIANEHGYDNGSKFSNAFRAVKGMNPAEYRKKAVKKI